MKPKTKLNQLMIAAAFMLLAASNQISFAEDTIFNSSGGFIKNMDQLLNTDRDIASDVLYYAPAGKVIYYLMNDKIAYAFIAAKDKTDQDTTHRVDLVLSDDSVVVHISENNQLYYNNYYLSHTGQQGIDSVGVFESIDYAHLYENIIVTATITNGLMLKYSVDPGANPYDLSFHFDGADSIVQDADGNIRVYCPLDSVVFDSIYAYQVIGGEEVPVEIDYLLQSDHVYFDVGTYDGDYPLYIIIGPQPIRGNTTEQYWSTFLQGGGDENYDVAIDANNYVYCTGSTLHPDFPVINGQYTTYDPLHGMDAFAFKFKPDRSRAWGSFFGGTGIDIGRQVVVNSSGYVYIAGISDSSGALGTAACTLCDADSVYLLDSTFNGGAWDIFIAKFDSYGQLDPTVPGTFASYFGGSGNEEVYSMTIDTNDIVYLSGYADTGSYNHAAIPFPYVPMTNAYNQDFDTTYGGVNEAFVVAIGQGVNTPNDVLWSSAVGGDNNITSFELITDLTIDGYNNLYATGVGDLNTGVPLPHPVQQGPVSTNGYPGFFPLVDPDTNSATEYVAQPKGLDAIVIKFNNDRAIEWSTFFGGDYVENIHVFPDGQGSGIILGLTAGIAVNNDGKIFITGSTQSDYDDGFPHQQLSGAYDQDSLGDGDLPAVGATDAFIAMFNSSDSLIWSTFYGGNAQNHYDWGTSVTVDSNDYVYFSGWTVSEDFDLQWSTGEYSQLFNYSGSAPGGDAYILKFNSAGIRQYAMYYGGGGDEWARSIAVDLDGTNIIFCGRSTFDSNFPFDDPGGGAYFWGTTAPSAYAFITNMQFNCNPCLRVGDLTENASAARIFTGYPYPNPAADYIAISDKECKNISVFNSLGATVKSFNKINSAIYIADLPVGLYLIKFEDSNGKPQTVRFIKQ